MNHLNFGGWVGINFLIGANNCIQTLTKQVTQVQPIWYIRLPFEG